MPADVESQDALSGMKGAGGPVGAAGVEKMMAGRRVRRRRICLCASVHFLFFQPRSKSSSMKLKISVVLAFRKNIIQLAAPFSTFSVLS